MLQLRRGTAARWTSQNPVLEAGRPGFEDDTFKLKIGDGSTRWVDLPYIGGTGSSRQTFLLGGSAAGAGQTVIELQCNGESLIEGEPGIPVTAAMTATRISVSFLCDDEPAGDGTVTLWRRPAASDTFSVEATMDFATT